MEYEEEDDEPELIPVLGYDDSYALDEDELDMRECVTEVVNRLPEDVREWLLYRTQHQFVCLHERRARAQLHRLLLPPFGEKLDEMLQVRVVLLSSTLPNEPREQVLLTIAEEIAHSWRNDFRIGPDEEEATGVLMAKWGFPPPPERLEVIAEYRASPAFAGGGVERVEMFHVTRAENVEPILRDGFHDGERDGIPGVWLSNRPLWDGGPADIDSLPEGWSVVRVSAPASAIDEYEVRSDEAAQPYREWCLPAAVLNCWPRR